MVRALEINLEILVPAFESTQDYLQVSRFHARDIVKLDAEPGACSSGIDLNEFAKNSAVSLISMDFLTPWLILLV